MEIDRPALLLLGFLIGLAVGLLRKRTEVQVMAVLEFDATKKVKIKRPVVKVKDIEGSPKGTRDVENWIVTVENGLGHVGEISDLGDGNFEFNPGDEVEEQASGEFVGRGNVGNASVEWRQPFELRPGSEDVLDSTVEPEIEVEETAITEEPPIGG